MSTDAKNDFSRTPVDSDGLHEAGGDKLEMPPSRSGSPFRGATHSDHPQDPFRRLFGKSNFTFEF
jgi:hypothetical protein